MGFDGIRQEMATDMKNGDLKGPESSPEVNINTELAPSAETAEPQSAQAPSQPLTKQETIELDKLEKFKINGEEWTPKTLQAAMLRQQDYSKKTQETAQERKFLDNFEKDIETVKGNPSLAAEFKRIYPPKYHQFVDRLLSTSVVQEEQPANDLKDNDLFKDPRIQQLLQEADESRAYRKRQDEVSMQQNVKTATQEIEATLRELVAKHNVPKEAQKDVELVTLKKIEELISFNKENPDKAVPLTGDIWNKAYEQTYADFNRTMEALYKQKVNKQTEASKKAKDIGAGGGTLANAPTKVPMKDVKAQMLNDIKMGKAMAN